MKLLHVLLIAAASLITLPARAADYALGLDLVRAIDRNQDDGMFNLWFQFATTGNGAVMLGYSSGDNLTILDVGYKHYSGGRMNSVYFQGGVGYYDTSNDDDLGFVGAIGYERKLAKHFVVGGSVKMIIGVDEAVLGLESPAFQPTLSMAVAF
jgi:hypothetical protein